VSVYKWKDDKGRLHYSDKKPSDGLPVDIGQTLDKKDSKFTLNYQALGSGTPVGLRDQLRYSTDKIFALLSEGLSVENIRPIELNISIYGEEQEYLALRQRLYPSSASNAPGFYSLEHNLAAVLNRRRPEDTRRTAIHEAAHVVIAGLYGGTPRWFTEGFAEYASSIEVRGQLASVKSNDYWFKVLRQLAKDQGLPSLAAYWAAPMEHWESELKARYYAIAWSVIAFMMDDAERRENLSSYMRVMESNYCQPLGALRLSHYYPGGMKALQSDWERWVTQSKGFTHRY
jgi:predicted DNA-binding ribbon-helix-helix protein